jgi:hypothetical protein
MKKENQANQGWIPDVKFLLSVVEAFIKKPSDKAGKKEKAERALDILKALFVGGVKTKTLYGCQSHKDQIPPLAISGCQSHKDQIPPLAISGGQSQKDQIPTKSLRRQKKQK